jgi:hypothetical protein
MLDSTLLVSPLLLHHDLHLVLPPLPPLPPLPRLLRLSRPHQHRQWQ